MNILLLGSGGREHAIAWKLAQSAKCKKLIIAPGNAGTDSIGINESIDILDFQAVSKLIHKYDIQMVVVGPEQPLVAGVYDHLTEVHPGLIVIGPSQLGATLEGSKAFAKQFMQKHGIPTAAYIEVTQDNIDEGVEHLRSNAGPYVLKADGLAAGKGVLIIEDRDEAISSLRSMIEENQFGEASSKVVIEAFLDGIEFSVFALTDGKDFAILPTAKDYKRIGEGDTGLNTGGMGAISPPPFVTPELMDRVIETVVEPTVKGLQVDNITYKGFIYFGLILVGDQPFVIEYNCRMGDPETQLVMARLDSDLVELFEAVGNDQIKNTKCETTNDVGAGVVIASQGYPTSYPKGMSIRIPELNKEDMVFHAGTKLGESGDLLANGGRVMMAVSLAPNLSDAVRSCMSVADQIQMDSKYYRKDIGYEFV